MTRLILAILLGLLSIQPALAHKLKVFATVEGEAVTGYAFFIGGGRAQGAKWAAVEGDDAPLGEGRTDAEGRFSVVPPQPVTADIRITIDTEEGHIASAVLPAARFGGVASDVSEITTSAAAEPAEEAAPAPNSDETARLVEAAVQRQVEPLLERIEAMDSRLRYTDMMSGLFLIAGLAGMALWALGRKGRGK